MIKQIVKKGLNRLGLFKFEYSPFRSLKDNENHISFINEQILNDKILPNAKKYSDLLLEFNQYRGNIMEIPEKSNTGLSMVNGYYPGLDIFALYGMLNHLNPRRIIEVGSGFSTLVMQKCIAENNLNIKVTCIDPNPRTDIEETNFEILRQPVENVKLDIFQQLDENDVLIIDSSHRVLPDSDLIYLFEDVFPNLKKGVVVHVHDIYIPYEYPFFMKRRLYSEQYLLSQMLRYNDEIEVLFPSFYLYKSNNFADDIESLFKEFSNSVERHGGSFWIQKVKRRPISNDK